MVLFENRLYQIITSKLMASRVRDTMMRPTRMASFFIFTTSYWKLLEYLRTDEDEVKRLAGAGSLVTHICELSFYLGDTINSKSKVSQDSLSMMRMLNNVLKEEGANGLAKGISATYYGSVLYGMTYFYTYPYLKKKGHAFFEKHNKLPLLYFLCGIVAEYSGLLLYYPFETVKVRFQVMNADY